MIGRLLPPPTLVKQGEVYYLVPAYQAQMRKLAAMAGDLRAVTFPKQHRVMTNPPTEGSKQLAFKSLAKTQRVGQLAAPKGPSIRQIAVKVR